MKKDTENPELPLIDEEDELNDQVERWAAFLKTAQWQEYEAALKAQIEARRHYNETLGVKGGLDDMVEGYARRAEISALELARKLPYARLEVLREELKLVREGIELDELDAYSDQLELPADFPANFFGAP